MPGPGDPTRPRTHARYHVLVRQGPGGDDYHVLDSLDGDRVLHSFGTLEQAHEDVERRLALDAAAAEKARDA
jgi:hypothetical protein